MTSKLTSNFEQRNPNIRVGKAGDRPEGDLVTMEHCPHCGGRGYFLANPFATGGSNGCGGIANIRQCLTCLDCSIYYAEHGVCPAGYEQTGQKPNNSVGSS